MILYKYQKSAEANHAQIKLLELQYPHIGELITFARKIMKKGVQTMNFEVFNSKEIEQYKHEAKSKWTQTKAYKEYEQRNIPKAKHGQVCRRDDVDIC